MEAVIHGIYRDIIEEIPIRSRDQILQIPTWMLPMPVFAFNPLAFMSFAAGVKTRGQYGHFMWLIDPNEFASQSWWFQSVPIVPAGDGPGHYDKYILKFVYNPAWTDLQRAIIIAEIRRDLARPWWQTAYDVPQLLGHLVGLKWIQLPGFEVCSDRADYIRLVDSCYDLYRPTPTDVNILMKSLKWSPVFPGKSGFLVYGRTIGLD